MGYVKEKDAYERVSCHQCRYGGNGDKSCEPGRNSTEYDGLSCFSGELLPGGKAREIFKPRRKK